MSDFLSFSKMSREGGIVKEFAFYGLHGIQWLILSPWLCPFHSDCLSCWHLRWRLAANITHDLVSFILGGKVAFPGSSGLGSLTESLVVVSYLRCPIFSPMADFCQHWALNLVSFGIVLSSLGSFRNLADFQDVLFKDYKMENQRMEEAYLFLTTSAWK